MVRQMSSRRSRSSTTAMFPFRGEVGAQALAVAADLAAPERRVFVVVYDLDALEADLVG